MTGRLCSPHAPEFAVSSLSVREALSAERLEELRKWVAAGPYAAPGTWAAGLRELVAEVDRCWARIVELEAVLDGHRPSISHEDAAAKLRTAPGVWLMVGRYGTYDSARQVASQIRNGKRPAYRPPGAFRARTVSTVNRHEVSACFVGELAAEVTG